MNTKIETENTTIEQIDGGEVCDAQPPHDFTSTWRVTGKHPPHTTILCGHHLVTAIIAGIGDVKMKEGAV